MRIVLALAVVLFLQSGTVALAESEGALTSDWHSMPTRRVVALQGAETGESRTSPLPVGTAGRTGDYEVTVLTGTPDAGTVIAAENQFNAPPTEGNQFFLASVVATYVGATSGNPAIDLSFQAVGESNASYTTFSNSCGVIPNDQFLATEQFTGGTAEFNVCWQIASSDAASLVMFVEPSFAFNATPVWFSLGNTLDQSQATPEEAAATTHPAQVITESTRETPIPVGSAGKVGDYEIRVVSVSPIANDIVAAENQFNAPPPADGQFFLVTVSATYTGATSGNPAVDLNLQSVGASSSAYTTFNNSCGVIPNDMFMTNELFSGGAAEFNICWAIDSADADTLVMFVEPSFSFDAERVWFSLKQ